MLEIQREAIVADVTAQSVSLISRELDALQNYLNAFSTQAAIIAGFSLWEVQTPLDSASEAVAGAYFIFSILSQCSLIIVCVHAGLVSARASTFALTSGSSNAMRQAVLMVRQDVAVVQVEYAVGVVSFLAALMVEYGSVGKIPSYPPWQKVCNVGIVASTLVAIFVIAVRSSRRYRYDGGQKAVVSGDAFVRMAAAGAAPTAVSLSAE